MPCGAAIMDRHPQTFTQPVMRSGPSPSIFAYIASPAFQGRFLTLRHGRIDKSSDARVNLDLLEFFRRHFFTAILNTNVKSFGVGQIDNWGAANYLAGPSVESLKSD